MIFIERQNLSIYSFILYGSGYEALGRPGGAPGGGVNHRRKNSVGFGVLVFARISRLLLSTLARRRRRRPAAGRQPALQRRIAQ